MNIHEYQAKELLAAHGIAVPAGYAAMSVEEAVAAARKLPGPLWIVKAQIHAGGRGKGKFKELPAEAKGGVRLARSIEEVEANARDMLGNTLVTIQTGASTSLTAPTSLRNFTCRCWLTAKPGALPWWFRPKAGWTLRRWRMTRRKRSRR
jgi:succinyl-CoA synthetase beta subunit